MLFLQPRADIWVQPRAGRYDWREPRRGLERDKTGLGVDKTGIGRDTTGLGTDATEVGVDTLRRAGANTTGLTRPGIAEDTTRLRGDTTRGDVTGDTGGYEGREI